MNRPGFSFSHFGMLMQRLEAHARTLPGFQSRAQWLAEMARRMGVA